MEGAGFYLEQEQGETLMSEFVKTGMVLLEEETQAVLTEISSG